MWVCASVYINLFRRGKTPRRGTQAYSYNSDILADKFTTLGSVSIYIKYISGFKYSENTSLKNIITIIFCY